MHLYGFEVVLVVEDLDWPLLSLPPDTNIEPDSKSHSMCRSQNERIQQNFNLEPILSLSCAAPPSGRASCRAWSARWRCPGRERGRPAGGAGCGGPVGLGKGARHW